MTQPKQKTMEDPALIAVRIVPDARKVLPVDEIARAVVTHLDGQFHAFRHRYAEELLQQQVQLETFHETEDGRKFCVITEYHESFTVVDLVDDPQTH